MIPEHLHPLIRQVDTGTLDHDLNLRPGQRIPNVNAAVRSWTIAAALGDVEAVARLDEIHQALQKKTL